MNPTELLNKATEILKKNRPDLVGEIDAGRIVFVIDGPSSVMAHRVGEPGLN